MTERKELQMPDAGCLMPDAGCVESMSNLAALSRGGWAGIPHS